MILMVLSKLSPQEWCICGSEKQGVSKHLRLGLMELTDIDEESMGDGYRLCISEGS